MRRAQCKNNLKQMGTAAGAHVASYGCFPSDGWGMKWIGDADRGSGASQPGSWIYQLMPFMGLDMIHDLGKGQGSGANPSSLKCQQYGPQMMICPVPQFNCPARRKAAIYPNAITQGALNISVEPTGLCHSDYAANCGSNPVDDLVGPTVDCLNTFPNCVDTDPSQPASMHGWNSEASQDDGVVFQASQVTQGNITDGLSTTFFVGEKLLDPQLYYTSTDAGDDNSMVTGFDHDTVRWTTVPAARDSVNDPCTGGPSLTSNSWWCNNDHSFGSAHSSGVHFVFCDGSVRIISYSIDQTTYHNLGCRNDGQGAQCESYLASLPN
jgi:prepilin-type processing-associated H-X9-DG protein